MNGTTSPWSLYLLYLRRVIRNGNQFSAYYTDPSNHWGQASMTLQDDIIRRFHIGLPGVRQWIDQLLDAHADRARAVSTLGFARVSPCFPREMLERAKVVTVPRVPFPPVDQFGLPELAPMRQMSLDGITFKDTYFLMQGHASESLHFHELVHVVQWARLGIDNFLLAYGFGLLQFGYEQSPLEQMAYARQRSFELGTLPQELVRLIEEGTDAIWNQAAPVVRGEHGGA
jgi:hypothetical protein